MDSGSRSFKSNSLSSTTVCFEGLDQQSAQRFNCILKKIKLDEIFLVNVGWHFRVSVFVNSVTSCWIF